MIVYVFDNIKNKLLCKSYIENNIAQHVFKYLFYYIIQFYYFGDVKNKISITVKIQNRRKQIHFYLISSNEIKSCKNLNREILFYERYGNELLFRFFNVGLIKFYD